MVDFSASVTVRATAELYQGLGASLAEGHSSIVSEATGQDATASVRAIIANTPISVGSVGWSGSITLPVGGGITGRGTATSFATILVGSLGRDNRESTDRGRGWAADAGEIVNFTSEVTLDAVARVLGMATSPSIIKAWIDRSEVEDTHGFVRCLPHCGGGITWSYRQR